MHALADDTPAQVWKETLISEGLALAFLSRVFYEEPTAEFIDRLVASRPFDDWPLGSEEPWVQRGLNLLNAFATRWSPSLLPDLVQDYSRLFVGPGILAPPWESVYLSEEHLLFERVTLEVRKIYRQFGLEVPRLGREPDDHLGLELAFLVHLCSMGQAAAEREEGDLLQESLDAQRSFLREHLLRWAPDCLQRVLADGATDYYRGVACLTRGSLSTVASLLGVRGAEERMPSVP